MLYSDFRQYLDLTFAPRSSQLQGAAISRFIALMSQQVYSTQVVYKMQALFFLFLGTRIAAGSRILLPLA